MKANCYSTFGFSLNEDFKEKVEVWIDRPKDVENVVDKRIFVCIEPNEISRINDYLKVNYRDFSHILTYDEELLSVLPNAVLFEYGTTWIGKDFEYKPKEVNLSFVCNNKLHCRGHKMRQKIWCNQNKISFAKKFFVGSKNVPEGLRTITNSLEVFEGNLVLEDSKYPLFDSMFHVCIENVSQKYFFTEKIIDCFLTKTIPIYWGCPNISDYFNTDGMVIFENDKDFFKKCESLSLDLYESKKSVIEENYEKAKLWVDYPGRLANKLKELGIK